MEDLSDFPLRFDMKNVSMQDAGEGTKESRNMHAWPPQEISFRDASA